MVLMVTQIAQKAYRKIKRGKVRLTACLYDRKPPVAVTHLHAPNCLPLRYLPVCRILKSAAQLYIMKKIGASQIPLMAKLILQEFTSYPVS